MKYVKIFIIGMLLLGCSKKDPEIAIEDGVTEGAAMHYVNSEISFQNNLVNNLDINGNHANDFYFATDFAHTPASFYVAYTISPSQLSFINVDKNGDPILMKKGDKIDESLNWINSKNLCLFTYSSSSYPNGGSYSAGNWSNVKDGYLGFKIVRENKTSYGWMRLDVDSSPNSFFLKDYAYLVY